MIFPPVSLAILSAISFLPVGVGWHMTRRAPYPLIASHLTVGVPSGTTTVQGSWQCCAAHATACPWLPLLWVTIMGGLEPLSRQHFMAFSAPRALNDPVFWNISVLKNSWWPDMESKVEQVMTSVL